MNYKIFFRRKKKGECSNSFYYNLFPHSQVLSTINTRHYILFHSWSTNDSSGINHGLSEAFLYVDKEKRTFAYGSKQLYASSTQNMGSEEVTVNDQPEKVCPPPLSQGTFLPSAHSTKAPGRTSSSGMVMPCNILWHTWHRWVASIPTAGWQDFHLKGVFMILTSLSTYPSSITRESRADFRVTNMMLVQRPEPCTSVKHSIHLRGRNTLLEPYNLLARLTFGECYY